MLNQSTVYNRQGWIDSIRGILMILVYLYHSDVFYGKGHIYSWIYEPIFLSGFFFVSGFLFISNWKKNNLNNKIKQVIRGILIPYILFMLAFLLPKIILLNYNWKETLSDILLLRASWFVISIGGLQLLYSVSIKYAKTVSNFIMISFIYAIIGYLCVLLYRNLPEWYINQPFLYSNAMPGCMPACINLTFLASPFFSLGILYRHYENKFSLGPNLKVGILLGGAYFILIVIDHLYLSSSLSFASCVSNNPILIILYFCLSMSSLIMICKALSCNSFLEYIGSNTLIFYYLNILCLRISGMLYNKCFELLNLQNARIPFEYINNIMVTLLAIIITFPMVYGINKYLPILTGRKDFYNKISKKLHLNISW